MSRRHVALFAMLALFLPVGLRAQTAETGVIEGRIVDETGRPLPSAAVQLAQADGSYGREAITSESGVFRVGFLPPGLYDVSVRLIGYRTTTVTGVRVRATEVSRLNLEIETAPVRVAELRVEATRDLIDEETTEFTTTLESEQIDLLPAARTATDLIKFMPGARPDQILGGSTSQANAYLLDGVAVNQPGFGGDFLLPNVDWLEQVTVKGLGAGAEYGNFQGGLLNLVTKSGDNTFRGQLRFNFEGESLAATNLNTAEAGSELDNRYEVNGEFRGPLVRDKLFFYLSAQEVRSDTRVVDLFAGSRDDPAFLPLFEERREFKLLGKLTWQATNRDKFNVYVGKDDVYTDNAGLNSIDSPETVTEQESPATFWNASWQRTFSDRHLFELKVTGYSGRNDFLPLHGQLSSVQLLGGDRNEFRNAIFTREREPQSLAVSANWDAYVNTGDISHRFKIGSTVDFGSWLEARGRNGGVTWRPELPEGGLDAFDPTDPSTWGFISSDWAGDIRLDANTLNGAVYVQDYMQINESLSINPGLRLGFWQGDLNPRGGESFTAVKDMKLAPRLGVVYDVGGEGEWVLKGHFGRYYQSLFALMFDRTEGGNVFDRTEFWDWIGDDLPEIDRPYSETEREQTFEFFGRSSAFDTGRIEDYNQPYVDQFVASVEKAIGTGWKAGVVYVHRDNHDILALQDRNLATNYTELNDISVIDFRAGEPVLDASGNPLVLDRLFISNDDILFVDGAPGLTPEQVAALTYEEDVVLGTADQAKRTFDQVQLTVERRVATWQAAASIVWTDLRGNFFSVSGYDSPFGTGVGPFVHPNEQINSQGDLDNFSDWEGKLNVSGQLPLELRGGAFLRVRSGDHYTPTYVIDRRNHDFETADGETLDPDLLFGVDGEAVFLEPRGSREFDARAALDLHLDRVISLSRLDLVVGLDVFNVFDTGALTAIKTTVNGQIPGEPQTLFGAARFRTDPRTVRLVASVRLP